MRSTDIALERITRSPSVAKLAIAMAMAKLEESGNIPADVNVIATNSTPASAGHAAKRQSAKVPKIFESSRQSCRSSCTS